MIVSLADAHFGLSRCTDSPDEVIRQVELGWKIADSTFDILPWKRYRREVVQAQRAAVSALKLDHVAAAERFVERGAKVDPDAFENVKVEIAKRNNQRRFKGSTSAVKFHPEIHEYLRNEFESRNHDHASVMHVVPDGSLLEEDNTCVLPMGREPSLDHKNLRGLHRARNLIAVSMFEFKKLQHAYPFLPEGFIRLCYLGFDRPDFDTEKEIDVAWEENEITTEILRRVESTRSVSKVSHPNLKHVGRARIYLDAPLTAPVIRGKIIQAQHLEAVPVVAGVGCIPEIVKGGYVFKPPVTSEEFLQAAANRILYLLDHEDERRSVAQDARLGVQAKCTWYVHRPAWEHTLLRT